MRRPLENVKLNPRPGNGSRSQMRQRPLRRVTPYLAVRTPFELGNYSAGFFTPAVLLDDGTRPLIIGRTFFFDLSGGGGAITAEFFWSVFTPITRLFLSSRVLFNAALTSLLVAAVLSSWLGRDFVLGPRLASFFLDGFLSWDTGAGSPIDCAAHAVTRLNES